MDYRDMLFKLFWTMLNAALAAAIVFVGDLNVWWGAAALAALQYVSTWLRQRFSTNTGATVSSP